ncbi:malto-oligosyltrehalose trehalohydrolase [Anabaena cylindrica FACHB-243]|uniref:Malto-oligosyltrehalose trehalohydrolase n=1 Tax=Anabaena cylindrica (strain ATCC 27899 / PCC 7122) TaxID=272123 RepID=K9ZEH2_ANACC|nr:MULTISPECIES: malto-oligosyltrehalose trehalohydrolase [Anabaena]AFZ56740.1 maltooligosyl trehalose hydrolase [Anabaena cylindrica PCC 7122]MBD2420334.1 malto-oligosyltrehalose trehalohydrolase [Anabaena cylindrica FACHB-243]MBY5283042.1 malto-oligosyltrehalose trehalohydrolase [Anabaena sp. CCAP 1446/1C]MBY5306641.1 malto-oligosyltrehalose trehalohydrolase [Anabaena sp. CCAP 1446/1C]MCM2407853.1 malto-oligosyltrehalose trehalohydrolase [Anabaena sp. CCAP 1446/1C]
MRTGANYLGNGECEFTVWSPTLNSVAVQILTPQKQVIPLKPHREGYWQTKVNDVYPDTLYRYVLDGENAFADPASQYQPEGVHGPSQVVDPQFNWTDDNWTGVPLESMIFYELHVGTFTPEGTFTAIIPRLAELRELGINAIELMPIAQFPGDTHIEPTLAYRNWGYDGVYPFAVQNSYGTPADLKELVNACHQYGIAVVLDVVYNHFGPEGNYMGQFAPYFTKTYKTPWGNAMNFDDAHSQGVRHYFIQNALYWLGEFHIDALRLDAIQAIYDLGAKHFLWELAEAIHSFSQNANRKRYLIAESDLNNPQIIRPAELGGYGLDAQWSDDFHHALHALLTGDRQGYYQDFGQYAQLAKAYQDTFVYDWQYAPHRKRFHGISCRDRPPSQFSVCIQNHDQIGNQMKGDRLWERISFEGLKLAAGAVLLSPYLPLLFMGEEYGETAPFMYFVSHSDPDLIQAVRAGRKEEFEAFHYDEDPPDPESAETFLRCKLNWQLRNEGKHKVLLDWYRQLIDWRKTHPALLTQDRNSIQATSDEDKQIVIVRRASESSQVIFALNFNQSPITVTLPIEGTGHKRLDSADAQWAGFGSQAPDNLLVGQQLQLQPNSLVLYELD